MQFHLRERPLEAQDKSSVDGSRVVDAVVVGDQGSLVATDVQKRVPVRAVAREARHLRGKDDAYPPERDPGGEFLESLAVGSLRSREPQVRVDHLDVIGAPAQPGCAFHEGILQTQALPVGEHLIGGGLADVDHGFAGQMLRRYQLRAPHRLPPLESLTPPLLLGFGPPGRGFPRHPWVGWACSTSHCSASSITACEVSLVAGDAGGGDGARFVARSSMRMCMWPR